MALLSLRASGHDILPFVSAPGKNIVTSGRQPRITFSPFLLCLPRSTGLHVLHVQSTMLTMSINSNTVLTAEIFCYIFRRDALTFVVFLTMDDLIITVR